MIRSAFGFSGASRRTVNQADDVLVDTRGSIYITDKQWGAFHSALYGGRRAPADGEIAGVIFPSTAKDGCATGRIRGHRCVSRLWGREA
jgi:hypothetical protein